MTSDWLSTLRD